jgi:hypothetical protein
MQNWCSLFMFNDQNYSNWIVEESHSNFSLYGKYATGEIIYCTIVVVFKSKLVWSALPFHFDMNLLCYYTSLKFLLLLPLRTKFYCLNKYYVYVTARTFITDIIEDLK